MSTRTYRYLGVPSTFLCRGHYAHVIGAALLYSTSNSLQIGKSRPNPTHKSVNFSNNLILQYK